MNYGGPVAVVDLREGEDNKRWWSFEDDGPLGNGTKARVIFDVYSNGAGVRVNAIGVTDHVPYDPPEQHLLVHGRTLRWPNGFKLRSKR